MATDQTGLDAAAPGKKFLGLFHAEQHDDSSGQARWPRPTRAPAASGVHRVQPARPATEPHLADDDRARPSTCCRARSRRSKGFYLQVEGASIDKQDHAENPCGQIGETVEFDRAIQVGARLGQEAPGHADHRHRRPRAHEPDHREDASSTGIPTGYSTNLKTRDGAKLTLTYGTAGGTPPVASPPSQQHTGTVVPVWAIGPQAANVLGTNDNTDLFDLIRSAKTAESAPSNTVVVPGPTQTVTAPAETVPQPTAPSSTAAFAAGAAVAQVVTRRSFRRNGLAAEVVSTGDAGIAIEVTRRGVTLATGSGRGSGETSVRAQPTRAGRKARKGHASGRITVTGPTGERRTVTRHVTVR